MASLKTKFSVGLFMMVGMAIVIVGVVWLGMSNYLKKGQLCVAYFDESVQGLDRDSAVKYRGVHVGRVLSIGIGQDENLIEVVMQIEADIDDFNRLKDEIAGQLKSVGITGLMFIELDRRADGEALTYPPEGVVPPYPVIPTRPSDIEKFFKGIDDVFATLRALDTQAISDELVQAIRKVNQVIDAVRIDDLVADIQTTINNLQRLVQPEKVERLIHSLEKTSESLNHMVTNADGGIDDLRHALARLDGVLGTSGPDVQKVTADLRESAGQVKRAMDHLAALMETTDQSVDMIQRQAMQTLYRLDRAGDNLNRFLDRLSGDPSQLLFSTQPVEKPGAP